ncbi:chlorite dismutase family protein [Paraburkholderia sp. BCC1885]|uniref:chlorite dismutase family protein n=1 Tax=Paraburkholderia sp. BCC1885 TaxID=2562669 RepID=UPI0021B21F15|nr:chlorite dismutase family protein [Paraburkholderia sp. BCC1885]
MGDPLPAIEGLGVYAQPNPHVQDAGRWMLRGIASNERYATRDEKTRLVAAQEGLGRPESTRAVLIPIRKNAQWWALTQDERRAIFEARSSHISTGLRYLPAVARKLYHCRDLSDTEPFDFLTWFEFAPEDEPHFDNLLAELRASAEWDYVGREVEIRLTRR